MTTQVRLMLLAAVAVFFFMQGQPTPAPPVPPRPVSRLDLAGLFVGETAADDAACLAALCGEIADEIEWDGRQEDPLLGTGTAFDTLRVRAREARMKGESIGARQPRVREEISSFLTTAVGESGGPVDDRQRAAWVNAYREIEEACRNALRR